MKKPGLLSLLSSGQHLSSDHCLQDEKEFYSNCPVLCCLPRYRKQVYLAVCISVYSYFRVRRSRGEMYNRPIGHTHLHVCLCMYVCLSLAAFPHYCTDPDVTWGNGRRCPVVVHYWADLQSVNACFVAMTTQRRTRNVSECLYSLYAFMVLVFG